MRLPTGTHSRMVAARTDFERVIAAQHTPLGQTLVSNTREGLGGDLQGQLALQVFPCFCQFYAVTMAAKMKLGSAFGNRIGASGLFPLKRHFSSLS